MGSIWFGTSAGMSRFGSQGPAARTPWSAGCFSRQRRKTQGKHRGNAPAKTLAHCRLKGPEMIGGSEVEIVACESGRGEDPFLEFGLVKDFGFFAACFKDGQFARH